MSRRIWIIGAGFMGRSTLEVLLQELPDDRFVVVDRSASALNLAKDLSADRVDTIRADVQDDELTISEADLVINLAGPFFTGSSTVAEKALSAGCDYVDIADDVEGTRSILELNKAATEKDVTLITGAGLSPGVSNWLASDLIQTHPEIDGIQIAWVVHEIDPGGLAPLRHMLHMAVSPCPVWRDGKMIESPGFVPGTAKRYQMPEPVGSVEAYDTAHPEPLTLSQAYPQLRYASCQGALQPAWANAAFSTLGKIGFGYAGEAVSIKDVEIEPAEFLWRLMWQRYKKRNPQRQATPTTMVHVQGLSGDSVIATRTIWDDEVMARGTGLGAAAAALTILQTPVPSGAYGPEILPHTQALRHFEDLAAQAGGFTSGIIRDEAETRL